MKTYIPISIKRQALRQMSTVQSGQMSRREAEVILKDHVRYSSKLREDIIEVLTKDYDEQTVEAMRFFRLI